MKSFGTILILAVLAATANLAADAASKTDTEISRSNEVSAAKRSDYDRRYVVHRGYRANHAYQPRPYRGFADPSFGPDGRPYPVPEYLRNQCYIDMGYGRFQSCSNRS